MPKNILIKKNNEPLSWRSFYQHCLMTSSCAEPAKHETWIYKFKIIHEWPDVEMSKSKHKRVPRTTLCCWVLSSDPIGNKFLTNEFFHN